MKAEVCNQASEAQPELDIGVARFGFRTRQIKYDLVPQRYSPQLGGMRPSH